MYIRTVHETCVAESAHSLVNNTKSMENGGTLCYHRFLLVKYLLFAAILEAQSLLQPILGGYFAYLSCTCN